MCEINIWQWDKGIKANKLTFQCRMAVTFSTFKIMLAKVSESFCRFITSKNEFSGREALKLLKELCIGNI